MSADPQIASILKGQKEPAAIIRYRKANPP